MLKKVVAFVTGAAGTLGAAAAGKLVKEGAKVVLVDLPTSKGAEVAKGLGENAKFIPADVTSTEEVQNALRETVKCFGRLNTVVNCAGVTIARVVFNVNKGTAMGMDDFEKCLKVNVYGTVNVIRLAGNLFMENPLDEEGLRGLIINTSGFAAYDGQMGHALMAACWGAVASMTVPLCRDFAAAGVRVMTIAPGVFSSQLTAELPKKVVMGFTTHTPAPKRLGSGEDFAHLVQCIIENQFLNGEVIRLDGGLRMNLF